MDHPRHRRGGVVEDRPRDPVQAEDVDDGVHHADVALADERARTCAARDALGDTTSFGTPTGSACIAAAPISAPSAPPRHSTPWMRALGEQPRGERAHALLHQRHRRAARARRAARRRASSRPPRPPPRGVMSAAQCGSPRMPESIDDHVHPQRAQPLAHVGDLVALRVECPDQRDRGHQTVDRGAERRSQVRDGVRRVAARTSPRARRPSRGRAGTSRSPTPPPASDASPMSSRWETGVRSTRGDELDRQVPLVADRLQLADDRVPVERAVAGRHAVVVGDVEVHEPVARGADRARAGRPPRCSCGTRRGTTPQSPPTASASASACSQRLRK